MNSMALREDFEIAKAIFVDAGFDLQKIRLTRSTLRMEQPLAANTNLYSFPVLINIQNQAQPFPTERRLQQQDTIVVTHIGIFLAFTTGVNDVAFRCSTYSNPATFVNAVQMQALYNNADMFVTIDGDQWITNWDVMQHWNSPETQQTLALGAGSPMDQFREAVDGYVPCQPMLFLTGAQNIDLNIRLNQIAPTAVDANSRYVIKMRGFKAISTTSIR